MSIVTAPKSVAHIAVDTAINSVIDPLGNLSPTLPKAESSPPSQQQLSFAAKLRSNDLGPVLLPLVALAAPHFSAAEI